MPRFNFTNILLTSRADITDVMDNFNKIEQLAMVSTDVDNKINTALINYTPTTNLGGLATANYSYGTASPSGGSNGDIYDQYFD